MRTLFFCLLFANIYMAAEPLKTNENKPFNEFDAYIRNCPDHEENSIQSIAAYINRSAKTDLEKARGVYVWLTDNISYNDKGYNSHNFGDNSAEGVLKSRVAVCAGYADLFEAIAKNTGIEAISIVGYAKGINYEEGDHFSESNHAWNAVKIDNAWRIFDATWGEGGGVKDKKGRLKSIKEFNDHWFNVSPEQAVFTHYPENPMELFTTQKITLEDFESLPDVSPDYLRQGFLTAEEILAKLKTKKPIILPIMFPVDGEYSIRKAPKERTLTIGKLIEFEIECNEPDLKFFLLDENQIWKPLKRNNGNYIERYTPMVSGDLKIIVQSSSGTYVLMRYIVE